jgi:hypothetical protein
MSIRSTGLVPFNPWFLWQETAPHTGNLSIEELGDSFEIDLLAVEIGFTDLIYSFSPGSSSHLSTGYSGQNISIWMLKFTHRNDSATKSVSILGPWRISLLAGRLMHAARL